MIQCFPKFFSHRILRLGIKYSIKYLLGKLLNVSHEALNDLDSARSSAIIPNPQPPNILLCSLAPLKHLFSALGPSSSCCFSLVFFTTCFKSHFCRKPCPTPPSASTALHACFSPYTYYIVAECNYLFGISLPY